MNNQFVKEGMSNKLPPYPQPYAVGPDPPPQPPSFKKTPNRNPKAKDGPGVAPSYCGCVNSDTRILYNQNLDLLSEMKKKITQFTENVKKSSLQVKDNKSNILQSKKDDFTMCCTAGGDKRNDGEITVGLCRQMNKYKCPAPPKEDEDEDEDENLPSSKPTLDQIKRGY